MSSPGTILDGCDGMGECDELVTGKDCKSVSRAQMIRKKHMHSTTRRRIDAHGGLGMQAWCLWGEGLLRSDGYSGNAGLAMVGCFGVAGPEIILTVRGRLVFRIGKQKHRGVEVSLQ
jgi:hypothetical protein